MASLADVMARYPRWKHVTADLFTEQGWMNTHAMHRKRQNKSPCPECGATDLVYRYADEDLWFCFCGRTEVDDIQPKEGTE